MEIPLLVGNFISIKHDLNGNVHIVTDYRLQKN